ncbi:class I SAM-dependent methyltransferase [Sphingomonas sp.]|uniref:class I SAM-dependent methyltransferase n=1 Tax=Sphingomonas sp. TaxID=28214 RepID=UPI003B3A2279
MSNWHRGYVADIVYMSGFYANHAPAYLDFVCALAGLEPQAPQDYFTWCELGCGTGFTANLLAAAHPRAHFHAIDMAEDHIRLARSAADAASLDNILFHHADFGALEAELPTFDYIVAHGVYTWVEPEVQRSLVAFLDRYLKPGGVALISYNSLPGWIDALPLQRLLLAHARSGEGDSIRRLNSAMAFAKDLKAAGAPMLQDLDLEGIATPPPGRDPRDHEAYLAHEFLNTHWNPLLHSDVVQDLAPIGLHFVGPATIAGLQDAPLSVEQSASADAIADPALRETYRDYCAGTGFRSDVFVRAAAPLAPHNVEQYVGRILLAATGGLKIADGSLRAAGSLLLETEFHRAIAEALEAGVHSVAELLGLAPAGGMAAAPTAAALARMLVASEQIIPVRRREPGEATAPCERFNQTQIARTAEGLKGRLALATPLGNGLVLAEADAALLRALPPGPPFDPVSILEKVLEQVHGADQISDVQGTAGLDAARRATAQSAASGLSSMPRMLKRMGLWPRPLPALDERELDRAPAIVAPFAPHLPRFDSDLFIPQYQPMRRGDWELRIADFVVSPGYWSPPRLVTNMAALVRDQKTWMSITPMELESQEIGIRLARGHVAIFGMGLGWAAAATAAQSAVERVTVVEKDPVVLSMIEELDIFAQLPENMRAKVHVEQGDAYEWQPQCEVDLLMPDIWLPLISEDRVEEVRHMQQRVRATSIYFWGQEMEIARHAVFAGRCLDETGIRETIADWALPIIGPDAPDYASKVDASARRWMYGRWLPGTTPPF